jgi:V/A-type H+-transporting ATPase subunit C
MRTLAQYAYLNARVAGLATHLLSETRLLDMIQQPLGQQRTGLALLDNLLNDAHLTTNVVEQAWVSGLLVDFKVLVRSLTGVARELLIYWLRKYEMTNLKTIVRGKIAKLHAEVISAQLLDLGPIATLPLEQLLQTEDVNELLRRLSNTPYSNLAHQARRVFDQEHQLYSLDAAIDRHYLLELDKKVHGLETAQRELIVPLMSIFIDRFNLLWLLRYRFAYHLSPAETFYLLLPTHYRLNRVNLVQLVELGSFQEVIKHLPEFFQPFLTDADTIVKVEQRLNEQIRQTAQYTLHWHHFSVAKAIAYMMLRELEMYRILAIVKGKRLQLTPAAILAAAELSGHHDQILPQ